ncbi:HAD family acid phosphatase [Sphingomonas naphthae]|uniref:HAD family acid phosphatase n=1 Tax=Sphingomonas naphthae TaxID=1813468 RepID=A0ABY7TMW9_9SPHN|nr:HAD family acid phosphatase [Sphingomonas naphthae]WCT74581.1 HAD family acid phosphatase [Sphingomonas naphthae]
MLRAALPAVLLLLAGCATQTRPVADVAPPAPQTPPKAMQWLYGSGEGAAISRQAYNALAAYTATVAADRKAGRPVRSAILAPGATLDAPRFVECAGGQPLAAMFDVDETVLLNLGFEYDDAKGGVRPWDEDRWARWEQAGADKVLPVPGAVEALATLRAQGLTILFNSNRNTANGAFTKAAIEGAGLGPAVAGDTLYLKGDVAPGSGKDPRRLKASEHYCIVALGGDQLGDFSDQFGPLMKDIPGRRAWVGQGAIARLWGAGWFVLPNPLYGTGTVGSYDDVFPADKRWTDQGGK